ncbi:MAG: Shikimate kinase 2 [Candidatus Heimdallarchaeota archaeon LC_3]|nr:MAG: Shikimate kinase 2 [Candidatus Heimdallarchaeota archaeon LC_3]
MKNIILIGLPSSGKTYLGKKLSEKLSFSFLDTDQLMIQKINKKNISVQTIQECYSLLGEKEFRELESNILSDLNSSNTVISAGGGIIHKKRNREILKKSGRILYLKTQLDILEERIKNQDPRPLFRNNIKEKLKELEVSRENLFIELADFIIDANKSEVEILTNILEKINQ